MEEFDLQIYNVLGKNVLSWKKMAGSDVVKVDLSRLINGVYYLEAVGIQELRKVVISK